MSVTVRKAIVLDSPAEVFVYEYLNSQTEDGPTGVLLDLLQQYVKDDCGKQPAFQRIAKLVERSDDPSEDVNQLESEIADELQGLMDSWMEEWSPVCVANNLTTEYAGFLANLHEEMKG